MSSVGEFLDDKIRISTAEDKRIFLEKGIGIKL